jgi:hypothetical protein
MEEGMKNIGIRVSRISTGPDGPQYGISREILTNSIDGLFDDKTMNFITETVNDMPISSVYSFLLLIISIADDGVISIDNDVKSLIFALIYSCEFHGI